MWTVFIFLIFWGPHLTVCTPPPGPLNVSFSSVNLRNVLHWFPGINTPDDTLYTVEYAIYGDSIEGNKGRRVHWRAVKKCREIARTWCDLSGETEDEEQGYHARVRAVAGKASSKWILTQRRFDPKVDTSFGPPLISVEIENNSAIVTLKGPMRYPSKNHSSVQSMAAIYPQMTYNLSINNTYRNQVNHVPVVISPHKYRLLDYSTEYCFSAQSRFLSMPIQCHPSAWHCIVTPKDPLIEHLQKVVVGIIVPGLCFGIIGIAGYLLHQYLTGKGQRSPDILSSPYSHAAPVTFPPEHPRNIIVSIIKNEPTDPVSATSDPECSRGQRPIAEAPPPYSPQNTGAHPEEAEDDLPDDYGLVGVVRKIDEDEDNERERWPDGGNAGTCAAGVFPLQKSFQMQNLVQTCRDPQAEINTRDHTAACLQINSTLCTQAQAPSLAFQGSTLQIVRKAKEEEEGVLPGLFSNKNTDEDEGQDPENQPLLSSYASQNVQNMSAFQAACSDYLPDDYAVIAGAAQETEEDDYDYEYEEECERVCVDWDPQTRKLMLPAFRMEERVDDFRESEGERRAGEEDDEAYLMKGELRLENVFVRQVSEEETEVQGDLERGGVTRWEVDDFLSRWNLEISMGD